jgi:hypothetical protein
MITTALFGMMFSRRLAVVAGVALPVLETMRRWHQLGDVAVWPSWLDDWAIGIFLLYGAWRVSRDAVSGRPILAAAWGFACGLGYASFFSQLDALNATDPSGLTPATVVIIKGSMLVVGIAALVATVKSAPPTVERARAQITG